MPGRLPAGAIVGRVEAGVPLEDLQIHPLDDQQRPGPPYFVARRRYGRRWVQDPADARVLWIPDADSRLRIPAPSPFARGGAGFASPLAKGQYEGGPERGLRAA